MLNNKITTKASIGNKEKQAMLGLSQLIYPQSKSPVQKTQTSYSLSGHSTDSKDANGIAQDYINGVLSDSSSSDEANSTYLKGTMTFNEYLKNSGIALNSKEARDASQQVRNYINSIGSSSSTPAAGASTSTSNKATIVPSGPIDYLTISAEDYKNRSDTTAENAIKAFKNKGLSYGQAAARVSALGGGEKLEAQLASQYSKAEIDAYNKIKSMHDAGASWNDAYNMAEKLGWPSSKDALKEFYPKEFAKDEEVRNKIAAEFKAEAEKKYPEATTELKKDTVKPQTKVSKEVEAALEDTKKEGTNVKEEVIPKKVEPIAPVENKKNFLETVNFNDQEKRIINLGGITDDQKKTIDQMKQHAAIISELEKKIGTLSGDDRRQAETELKAAEAAFNGLRATLRNDISNAESLYNEFNRFEKDVYTKPHPKGIIRDTIGGLLDLKKQKEAAESVGDTEALQAIKQKQKDLLLDNGYYFLNALGTALLNFQTPGAYGRAQGDKKSLWQEKQERELIGFWDRMNKARDEQLAATQDYIKNIWGEDQRVTQAYNDIVMDSASKLALESLDSYSQLRTVYLKAALSDALESLSPEQIIRVSMMAATGNYAPLLQALSAVDTATLQNIQGSISEFAKDIHDNGILGTLNNMIGELIMGKDGKSSWLFK